MTIPDRPTPHRPLRTTFLPLTFSALTLTACGGGGGTDSADAAVALNAGATAEAADSAQSLGKATADAISWTQVGVEGQSITVPANSTVRYGKSNSWVVKTVSGTIPCTNAYFGSDPLYGVTKQCDLKGSTNPPATGTAVLNWSAPAGAAVVQYRVYYGKAPGSYDQTVGTGASAGTAVGYTVSGLMVGTQYYFAVTAVDAAGVESLPSNEVAKLVQSREVTK